MESIAEPIGDEASIARQLSLGNVSLRRGPALEESLRACYSAADKATVDRLVAVALLIRDNRGIVPEEICRGLGEDYGSVSAALCLLESDGFISTDLLQRCTITDKKC